MSLQAPRRPHAEDGSHKEPQVEPADMDEAGQAMAAFHERKKKRETQPT